MRKATALIFLFSTAFWIAFGQLGVFTHFVLNQSEMTELFCVNKNKPRLKCDGKCHLKAQLNNQETKRLDSEVPVSVFQFAFFHSNNEDSDLSSAEVVELKEIPNSMGFWLSGYVNVHHPPPQVLTCGYHC